MILVILTAHTVSPDAAREFCRLFFTVYEMRVAPGHVRSSCAIHTSDPQRVVTINEWGSRAAWDAWASSEMRADRLQHLSHLLTSDLQMDVYEEA
jgi:heme-degrading monooxygenase HmoA